MPGVLRNIQESGRAGRDKNPHLQFFYIQHPIKAALKNLLKKFPPIDKIKDVYEALCNYLQVPEGAGKDNVLISACRISSQNTGYQL